MFKLPYRCAILSFSATLRNFTLPLLYYSKNNTNINLIAGSSFLGVMGSSLAILGYLKLPSQTSKGVIFYSSVA